MKPKTIRATLLEAIEASGESLYRIAKETEMPYSRIHDFVNGKGSVSLENAVRRNLKRFPADFMFQLSQAEFENWRSQFVASNSSAHKELARKLADLERKYDAQFKIVFDAIRELMAPPPEPKKGRIGFHAIQSESK
jgi:hypothetical protein